MNYIQKSIFDGRAINTTPLPDRIRPHTLDDYVGQEHILGKGKILRTLIDNDNITSMIFWGPPGVGKTTLAMIIAEITKANFINFSAVTSGIKEIKDVMIKAEEGKYKGVRTILFVDEIHRFNKAQQDAFLPHVEKGNIILIGATTENPSFQINSALLSRLRVFVLKPIGSFDIIRLLKNAMNDKNAFYGKKIEVTDEILNILATFCDGDARTALNILEMTVFSSIDKSNPDIVRITKEKLEDSMQKKVLLYDKNGEEHYNLISALHKSMRNSDPDAAIYWLARMLESGEDPLYVARRMIQFSSEDIGLADPRALQIAVSAYEATHSLGMPECSINLAEAAVYLSIAPKSNSLYIAYENAKLDAKDTMAMGVPLHLRNAPTKLMSELGYSKGYKYAQDYEDKITNMVCLPDNLKDKHYYEPQSSGIEKDIKIRLENIRKFKQK